MNARQRFLATMKFLPTDRPFQWESLGMWPETLDRWYAEGLPKSYKEASSGDFGAMQKDEYQRVLVKEFGFDRIDYLRDFAISGYTDTPFCPTFEYKVISQDQDTRVIQDVDGIIKREFISYGTSSMPQFMKFPVRNREDFVNLLPLLDPDHPMRTVPDWEEVSSFYASRDYPVGLTVCGAFGHPRNLLGVEDLCMAYYDQPALIEEILEHWVDFYSKLSGRIWKSIQFDFVLFWEDMAYKGGSLISPALVRRFMLPYYRRLIDHINHLGCEVIIVDSDGDVSQLVPLFLSAGVNAILPFEVQAGMDIRQFRKEYGKDLVMIGGLDKRLLDHPSAILDEELESKIPFMLEGGGYIPCLDHTAPPNISLSQFRYYVDQTRKISRGERATI